MEPLDLTPLTNDDLDVLARRIDAERRRRTERARADALRQIRELARAHGIEVAVNGAAKEKTA